MKKKLRYIERKLCESNSQQTFSMVERKSAAWRADVVRVVGNAKSSPADRVISAAFLLSPVRLPSPGLPPVPLLRVNPPKAWLHRIVQSRMTTLIRLPITSFDKLPSLPEKAGPADSEGRLQPGDSWGLVELADGLTDKVGSHNFTDRLVGFV